jgi:3-dehydroquinate dehydratase-1
MTTAQPIRLPRHGAGAEKYPLICTPLVGRNAGQLLAELSLVLAKQPDLLEWRVDFFQDIGQTDAVLALAAQIRQAAGATPLLFTRRCQREGGEPINLNEEQVLALYGVVCASGMVDCVDFEMSNDPAHIRRLREVASANRVQLILSFHDFQATPPLDELNARFLQAQRLGADIAKIAVMPQRLEDVLTLLSATLQSSQRLDIPLISMSMGAWGSLSRLFGSAFGSALTFAVGASSSAPGQVPIEDLRAVLDVVQRLLPPR